MTDITNIIAEIESELKPGERIDLLRWIEKYPSYQEEIIEYTILKHNEALLETEPVGDPLYDSFSVRANRILQNALGHKDTPDSVENSWLFSLIRRKNRRPEDVARSLKVGFSVLAKLDHGLLESSSIPRHFWRLLAKEIGVPEDMLHRPIISFGVFAIAPLMFDSYYDNFSFFSPSKPRVNSPVTFASAIEECEDMSDEEKLAWLKVISDQDNE